MQPTTKIPTDPGCYLFKDKKDTIIYIGKAKNLKKRVSSYFQKKDLDPKTEQLVANIEKIDYIAVDSEVEALILENNLIKENQPKYNINLKDSKRYAYIKQTDEPYPRLVLARKKTTNEHYYGPFVSAQTRDYILQLIQKTFQLRTCKHLPKKPCLRYHLNFCKAPCLNLISRSQYHEQIKNAAIVLKGKNDQLLELLHTNMKKASDNQQFELALEAREQIKAVELIMDHQKMERDKKYDEDIINFLVKDALVFLLVFNVHRGTLLNKQEFIFPWHDSFFQEFLVQYYSESSIPKEIILPINVDKAVKYFLQTKRSSVKIITPKIGDKKKLLDLVKKNLELAFFGNQTKLQELQRALKLQEEPIVIECFDISHLQGTSHVGSMVQFRNARPDKSNYRRFKIRTVHQIDDVAAIAEVVNRRYTRLINEKAELPNLIIIDGGKSQLNSAAKELYKLSLKIPIIAIAKRAEQIYVPGLLNPLSLKKSHPGNLFVQEIRDEAHRFAIKYNKLLRKKEVVK